MAIRVEDGTIVDGANSYVSETEAELYHEDRGNSAWDDADADAREAALIRACFGIENRYRGFWIGYRTNNRDGVEQVLAWPRRRTKPAEYGTTKPAVPATDTLYDPDGRKIGINSIPTALKHAQMEAALIELTERIVPTTVGSAGFVSSEKVGPLQVTYADNRLPVTAFPVLDRYLAGLARTGATLLAGGIDLTDDEREQVDPSSKTALEQFLGVDLD